MSKKFIIAAAFALNSLMSPYVNASDSDSNATEMSKEAWLKAMEPMLPGLICKGFMSDADLKKRFSDLKINYDDCVSMIPESEKKMPRSNLCQYSSQNKQ
jgi:hypothetical protein